MWNDDSMSYDSGGGAVAGSSGGGYGDLVDGVLSAFNTAANVYGKVAVADINANARYPMWGMPYGGGYPGQMYAGRQGIGVQMSPMLLIVIAGAIYLATR